eukprot:CAMPEP_0114346902 /NCGR_PEP_ID=MMETSP0101-20121206/13449_1 /TAXON_ID=38822 ORGANISM="Pteridomonas danica, Strain PT" /NCGR_SAMPLE_ID=MMETSP0101 /ASSEMBLY_ACC=CAM_ASM_000211 /LENGTH=96 /DNA_ID=CAMNT_0001483845 /DNA_START=174 /DNA_END=464 /DNA_ORIENTATION=-
MSDNISHFRLHYYLHYRGGAFFLVARLHRHYDFVCPLLPHHDPFEAVDVKKKKKKKMMMMMSSMRNHSMFSQDRNLHGDHLVPGSQIALSQDVSRF